MKTDKFILSGGNSHTLEMAMNRPENGEWNSELVHEMTQGNILGQIRQVLLGHAEIRQREYIVDLDVAPYTPLGWSVEEHHKGGQMKWDPTQIRLHLSDNQKNGKVIEGNKLRVEIVKLSGYNANLLDFLYKKENQHLIPESWKQDEKGNTRYIYFWGTIYRDAGGYLFVRFLSWVGAGWDWGYYWLDSDWYDFHPAAVPASQN